MLQHLRAFETNFPAFISHQPRLKGKNKQNVEQDIMIENVIVPFRIIMMTFCLFNVPR